MSWSARGTTATRSAAHCRCSCASASSSSTRRSRSTTCRARSSSASTRRGPDVHDGELILVAGALLAAGPGASLLAGRLRVPGLLLVLALGMVLGSDLTGLIAFDDYE